MKSGAYGPNDLSLPLFTQSSSFVLFGKKKEEIWPANIIYFFFFKRKILKPKNEAIRWYPANVYDHLFWKILCRLKKKKKQKKGKFQTGQRWKFSIKFFFKVSFLFYNEKTNEPDLLICSYDKKKKKVPLYTIDTKLYTQQSCFPNERTNERTNVYI